MKLTNAFLSGAVAVEAASIPASIPASNLPGVGAPVPIPAVQGFKTRPLMSALIDAVNDGANLTEILTAPAGLVKSVGAVDLNVTISLGLKPIDTHGRIGGGNVPIDFGRIGNPVAESNSRVSNVDSVSHSNERVSSTNPNARGRCTNPTRRVEWRNLRNDQRDAFVRSVNCLMTAPARGVAPTATTRFEELVWVHQQMVGEVHQSGLFLLWHRYYLHIFARMLREECGLAPNMPFPWWDQTRDSGNFAASGLFTDNAFGALPQAQNGQGFCINNGFGRNTLHIGPGSGNGPHCLARGENRDLTSQVSATYVNSCVAQSTYAKMRECIEYGPHAYGHNGIGPTMADVAASPSDVAFFLHHTHVDRIFKKWQDQAEARWTSIYACASPANPCPILGLDTVMTSRGIRPPQRVRDYLDTEGDYSCYTYDY